MTGNIQTQAQKFSRIGEVGVMLTLIEKWVPTFSQWTGTFWQVPFKE